MIPVSDLNTLNPSVEFLIPQDRISKCLHSSLPWTRGWYVDWTKGRYEFRIEYGKQLYIVLFDPLLCLKKFYSSLMSIYIT